MICPKCGKTINAGLKFCPSCGNDLRNVSQPINNQNAPQMQQTSQQFFQQQNQPQYNQTPYNQQPNYGQQNYQQPNYGQQNYQQVPPMQQWNSAQTPPPNNPYSGSPMNYQSPVPSKNGHGKLIAALIALFMILELSEEFLQTDIPVEKNL